MTTILHLIETSGPGGAERVLISLVEHLDRRRYHSIVCLPKDGWLHDQLKRSGVETVLLPQHRSFDVKWLCKLAGLIRSRRIHLMHGHEFTMNAYGSIVSALRRIPMVSTVHGKNYYPDKWRRRAAYRLVARRSTLVAVSEDIRRFLAKRLSINESRVTTIHNGIDLRRYRPDAHARAAIRTRLGLGGRPVVGTVGNLYPVKGQTYLLRAAAVVTAAVPEAVFLVAGRGDLLEPLQNEARALGLGANVMFLGFEEDIPSFLQALDIFVLPSLSEGLPLSVLEAMAAGKPVVATSVGGTPEVVIDADTGFLVPAGDTGALAARILQLLRNPALRDRFAERGRRRVLEEFALETTVHQYEALYEHALNDGSGELLHEACGSQVRGY
jgi:glycosyltransferase involved in cell wall biosynthesis